MGIGQGGAVALSEAERRGIKQRCNLSRVFSTRFPHFIYKKMFFSERWFLPRVAGTSDSTLPLAWEQRDQKRKVAMSTNSKEPEQPTVRVRT